MFTRTKKVSLEAVNTFARTVKRNDYMVVFDLSSAFHHIRIAEPSRKLMGIKFKRVVRGRVAKRWTYARYAALPFGWRRSTEKLYVLTRPLIQHWLELGLAVLLYVDDGISFGAGEQAMADKAQRMVADLTRLGFAIAFKKSDFVPKTRAEWCGHVWDTASFTVSIPAEKTSRFRAAIQSLHDRMDSRLQVKEVAQVVGKIVSCVRALGRIAILLTRSLTGDLAAAVKKSSWHGTVLLSTEAKQELEYWLANFARAALAGQPIRTPASAHVIKGIKMSSDAGEFYMGACVFQSQKSGVPVRQFQLEFEEGMKDASSTLRELVGIYEGLKDATPMLRGQTCTLLTDNRAAEKSCNVGSMIRAQQLVAVKVWEHAAEHGIDLRVLWSRRSEQEGKAADMLTRTWEAGRSSFKTEFRVADEDFQRILRHTGIACQIDVLASHWSHRLPRFFSEYNTVGAEGRDAFALVWPKEELWVHAEASQLIKIMEKAEAERARGLLLTAYFPAKLDFRQVWDRRGPRLRLLMKLPLHYESPHWRKNACFSGLATFDSVVLRFDFRAGGL